LKSAVQTSLACVIGPRDETAATAARRRRRPRLNPRALRCADTVDGDGQSASGAEGMTIGSSFFGPQRGWRWRNRISAWISSGAVACGL
jgi:hypothetical protein